MTRGGGQFGKIAPDPSSWEWPIPRASMMTGGIPLFHCKTRKKFSDPRGGRGIPDKMIVRHQVNGWEMILFNRVVYED